ncbi:MAG: arginine--tRNA ligase [Lachnospiraceae bacterium]|nr:arginine--tRNA ligase [Lachnospiraceae bacterium]
MQKILEKITDIMTSAFEKAGYGAEYGKVSVSNRPDLCDFQCNGAMAAAKAFKKAPIQIANEIVEPLKENVAFESIEAVMPGFINIKIADAFLAEHLTGMKNSEKFGLEKPEKVKTIVVDYGGANVAKPLHVGHLRPAVIGESVKRICKYMGHNVIGDAHLGDWGLQMGEVIEELRLRKPDLPYFDPDFKGEFPKEAPFTISDLEEIYPAASARMKEDDDFAVKCHEATVRYQKRERGYAELGQHIINVSKVDLKRNYDNLDVHFELWKGESDADPYVKDMVDAMVKSGLAFESQGALVVDIREEGDKKEYPPCIIRKSDGAAIYETTDLATLVQREQDYKPDMVIYVVDKRQELHFIQVFRTAKKAGIVPADTDLRFIGNGTVNGKDNKPFKTRDGGTLRLEALIKMVNDAVYDKIMESREESPEDAAKTAKIVGLAALKYGDLSNQATKDYIFDTDKFTSFEGNTGPYILYTIVRIKSILNKYREKFGEPGELSEIKAPSGTSEKNLMLKISSFHDMLENAFKDTAPHVVCRFVYELADAFNGFYHDTKILTEEDKEKREGWIALLELTKGLLECGIDLLGFSAPDRM